jgi:putative MATE family efflux protein
VLATLLHLAAPNLGEAAARVGFIATDAVFVGWLGKDALAGVSLVFPLFLICQTVSAGGIGTGIAAAVAGALGAGERGRADRLAAQALWLALGAGVLFGASMLAGGPALYRAFGASGSVLVAATRYSAVTFGGIVLVWLMNLLANAVRGTGAMTVCAGAIVAGGAVHLALSPTLILGLGPFPALGVVGAGIAVLASYGTGATILFCHLLSRRAGAQLRADALGIRKGEIRRVLAIGVPATMTVVLWQATSIALTILIAGFGPAVLAGFGAAQRLELLQTPITFGLGSAAIAMIAANLGAAQPNRARTVGRLTALLGGFIGLGFACAAVLAPSSWMALFTHDPAVAAAGRLYLRNIGLSLPLVGVGFGLAFSLMGAGRATGPALASLLRLGVIAMAGAALVPVAGGGLPALFATAAAANIGYAVMNAGLSRRL